MSCKNPLALFRPLALALGCLGCSGAGDDGVAGLALNEGCFIVHVVDTHGNVVSGAACAIADVSSGNVASRTTWTEGVATWRGVPANLPMALTVGANGFDSVHRQVSLRPGWNGIELRLTGTRSLFGRVVDPDGSPVCNVEFEFSDGTTRYRSVTRDGGSFSICGIGGSASVTARSLSAEWTTSSITPIQTSGSDVLLVARRHASAATETMDPNAIVAPPNTKESMAAFELRRPPPDGELFATDRRGRQYRFSRPTEATALAQLPAGEYGVVWSGLPLGQKSVQVEAGQVTSMDCSALLSSSRLLVEGPLGAKVQLTCVKDSGRVIDRRTGTICDRGHALFDDVPAGGCRMFVTESPHLVWEGEHVAGRTWDDKLSIARMTRMRTLAVSLGNAVQAISPDGMVFGGGVPAARWPRGELTSSGKGEYTLCIGASEYAFLTFGPTFVICRTGEDAIDIDLPVEEFRHVVVVPDEFGPFDQALEMKPDGPLTWFSEVHRPASRALTIHSRSKLSYVCLSEAGHAASRWIVVDVARKQPSVLRNVRVTLDTRTDDLAGTPVAYRVFPHSLGGHDVAAIEWGGRWTGVAVGAADELSIEVPAHGTMRAEVEFSDGGTGAWNIDERGNCERIRGR